MRFAITIEYDGSNFVGWQRQINGLSVQEVLEKALFELTGEKKTIQGAGRTDAGVHALGQVAHFDLKKTMTMDTIRDGLNFHIKKIYKKIKVSVLTTKKVTKDFHARFSAKQKTYVYKILDRRPPPAIEKKRVWHIRKKLDDKTIKKAAKILVGRHDFTSFRSTECQAKSPLKTIDSIKISRIGEEIQIWIKARSFLHNQVRIIVGTLVLVGRKKWEEKNIGEALKSKKRAAAGQTAPAEGLYLHSVKY